MISRSEIAFIKIDTYPDYKTRSKKEQRWLWVPKTMFGTHIPAALIKKKWLKNCFDKEMTTTAFRRRKIRWERSRGDGGQLFCLEREKLGSR